VAAQVVRPKPTLPILVGLEALLILVAGAVSRSHFADDAKLAKDGARIQGHVVTMLSHWNESAGGQYKVGFLLGQDYDNVVVSSSTDHEVGDALELVVDPGPPVRVLTPNAVNEALSVVYAARVAVVAGALAIPAWLVIVARRRRIATRQRGAEGEVALPSLVPLLPWWREGQTWLVIIAAIVALAACSVAVPVLGDPPSVIIPATGSLESDQVCAAFDNAAGAAVRRFGIEIGLAVARGAWARAPGAHPGVDMSAIRHVVTTACPIWRPVVNTFDC
jgi:hypothetical protein